MHTLSMSVIMVAERGLKDICRMRSNSLWCASVIRSLPEFRTNKKVCVRLGRMRIIKNGTTSWLKNPKMHY